MAVTLAACSHKLHLVLAELHLGRAEVAENSQVGSGAKVSRERLGHLNPAPDDDDVDVVCGAFQKKVAHVSPNQIAFQAQTVGRLG